jgi:hypothetical protein
MSLDVHLMGLTIVFCLTIQPLQMEKNMILCFKCYNEYDAPTYGEIMSVFDHQHIWKKIYQNTHFICNCYLGLHIQSQNWGFSIGEIIDVSLSNSPLVCWDSILDKEISLENNFQVLFFLFYHKIWKVINGRNNTWLFFNNQMILKVCAFCLQMLLITSSENMIFLMANLKVCMLLMKYKFYHY